MSLKYFHDSTNVILVDSVNVDMFCALAFCYSTGVFVCPSEEGYRLRDYFRTLVQLELLVVVGFVRTRWIHRISYHRCPLFLQDIALQDQFLTFVHPSEVLGQNPPSTREDLKLLRSQFSAFHFYFYRIRGAMDFLWVIIGLLLLLLLLRIWMQNIFVRIL